MTAQTGAPVIPADRHDVSRPLRAMVLAPLHLKGDVVPGEHSDFEDFSEPIKGPAFAKYCFANIDRLSRGHDCRPEFRWRRQRGLRLSGWIALQC
jgi:hypothetical protein